MSGVPWCACIPTTNSAGERKLSLRQQVSSLQIAAERTASDLRALYDLKNKHRLGKVA